jgi:hypothetical protein
MVAGTIKKAREEARRNLDLHQSAGRQITHIVSQ